MQDRVITGINVNQAATHTSLDEATTRAYQAYARISAIVDITNYVMLELGQPMHAFDNAKLKGGISACALPRAGEKIVAAERGNQLTACRTDMLVIADDRTSRWPMAGIMGGEAKRRIS